MSSRRHLPLVAWLSLAGKAVEVLAVNPQFEGAVSLPGLTEGQAVVVADFNSDSLPDIMVITSGNTDDVLYANQGNRVFTAHQMPPAADGLAAAVGDLDGDGDMDVFVGTASTHDFYYQNNGGFSFTLRNLNQGGLGTTLANGVAIADLDADGKLDVAVATSGNTRDLWYKNMGVTAGVVSFTQNLLPIPTGFSGGTDATDTGIGDLNGDGKQDIFVSCAAGKQVVYQAGSTLGTFTAQTPNSPVSGMGCAVAALKSTTPKAQAFVCGAPSTANDFLVQHTSGSSYTITVNSQYTPGALARSSVGLADVDGDGDRDAFVTRLGSADMLAMNNGTGIFTTNTFQGATGSSTDVGFGDFDGDGDLDAAVSTIGPGGTADIVYYNNQFIGPQGVDTDGDGLDDEDDTDDDNDGVLDAAGDPLPLNPDVCGDSDGDGCDDCSVGTDNFGPLSDRNTTNDGTDTDGDGLCNTGDLDDDNDGMTDAYEAANGLNPLVNDASSDTDLDGLTAILEMQSGNNPNLRDTDGDGMPDGWEYHHFAVNQARVLADNSLWRFRDDGVSLGSTYHASNYDDSTWKAGTAELGYGDGNERTVVSFGANPNAKNITTYFRQKFNVAAVAAVQSATLSYVRDDGVCFTLNGTEIARDNLPLGSLVHNTLALSPVEGSAESTYLSTSVNPYQLLNGSNLLAVEIHQNTANSPDISFNAYLTVFYPPRQASPDVDNDGDGVKNLDEYVAGTDPQNPLSGGTRLFQGAVVNGQQQFHFPTIATAGGIGYAGKVRLYTVEFRDNLLTGGWTSLPGFINIPGDNLSKLITGTGNSKFYRIKTQLL